MIIPNIWKVIKLHGSKPPTKIYCYSNYSAGLEHRMTFWESPGVSEKLPFRRAGPKSHVFELFFRLENLE